MRMVRDFNKRMFLIWWGYPLATILVIAVTAIKYFARPVIISPDQIILYVLAIVPIALFLGLGPAIFASVISAIVNDFLFVSPSHTFELTTHGLQILIMLLVVGVIISFLSWTLRQNSKFNAVLTDEAPNPIMVTNPDTSIKYVNPALESLTGFSAGELIGKKSPYPWWPQENLQQFESENISGRSKELNRYERCYQKKNLERFWVEVNIKPVKDKSEVEYYLANWVDITERNRAEAQLKQSEEKLRRVFGSISDGILIADMDGNINDCNDKALKMLKTSSREDILGKNTLDLVTYEYKPSVLKQRQATLNEESIRDVQYMVKRMDGTAFPAEVSSTIARDDDGTLLFRIISARDITERQRAEEAIRSKELQLKKLFEVMAEGVILWDADLRVVEVNAEAERIFKMQRRDSEGQPFNWAEWKVRPQWQLIGPDEKPLPDEKRVSFMALKERSIVRDHESGLKWPDGSITWIIANAVPLVDSQGNIEGVLGTFRDNTMRRQMLDRVRQSELQFQKLFDSMEEGVSLVSPDGRTIKSNPADKQILRLTIPKTGSFRVDGWKYVSPDGQELPLERMATYQAIKTKHPVRNPEAGVVRDDGSTFWISVNAVPLLDENGEVTGTVRVITDITEQKRMREEREQFTRKLLEAQEAERKRIARDLHDDAAQNLALIVMELDHLLSSDENLSVKFIENLKHLRDDTDRTQKEIRRYSHELRPGVLDYLGLEAALEGLVEDINSRGYVRVELEIEGKEDHLPEEVELALFRIAQEAINNIWKHSEATEARIILDYSPDKVHLTIKDNGKGFGTDEKQEAGLTGGLGLIGMKERAQLIGAKLGIESKPGQGTEISIEVPNTPSNSKQ